jgi:outer membrane lipoprotein LolB
MIPCRAAVLLALALLVAGCTSAPTQSPISTAPEWTEHSASLAALETWSFSGKIALQTSRGADSASLKWRQSRDDLEFTVSGPVGIKEATLVRERNRLSLLRNGERRPLAPGDDPLLHEFGWSLPLDYLPWWLRGLPHPELPTQRSEISEGHLALLEQAGWTLEYPDYQWVDGRLLPRVIRFSREDVSGKILLKRWTLGL